MTAPDEVEASGAARSALEALLQWWRSSDVLAPESSVLPGWRRVEDVIAGGELLARGPFAGVDEQRLILVVEDDDLTRAFLLDNLAADGFRVAGASGAGEGLRAIEVRQPALVVLDLALEDASGLALLDRVRAADGLATRIDPDLPVLVLSGRSGDATACAALLAAPTMTCASPRLICFPRCGAVSAGALPPVRSPRRSSRRDSVATSTLVLGG
jgi:CheY-like chemotaxis protein